MFQALHPGNNKQIVLLALVVIHETTITTAAQSYFPNQKDIANFWWTISNFKKRFPTYILGNAITNGGKKLSF